jgi:hypothetical protein
MKTENNIYKTLLYEKIDHFIYSFKQASRELFFDKEKSRLIHAGEFGRLREGVSKNFIRFAVPRRLDIGTGFVMNHVGDVSTQVDLIVYDKIETPLVQDSENQCFYPVETACAVGEIKSVLKKDDFKIAINKLAKIKELRERISETDTRIIRTNPQRPIQSKFDPIINDSDRLFTFMICERFDFDIKKLVNELNSLYESDIEPRNKHNMVLSIDDGLLLYMFPGHTSVGTVKHKPVPVINNPEFQVQKNVFLARTEENPNYHLQTFCTYLFSRTQSISILSPDLSHYLGVAEKGAFIIER